MPLEEENKTVYGNLRVYALRATQSTRDGRRSVKIRGGAAPGEEKRFRCLGSEYVYTFVSADRSHQLNERT